MKSSLYPTVIAMLFGFLLHSYPIYASDPLIEKKRTYSKTYALGNADRVSLKNQFGEMKIIPWDKNEIKVDITIVTKGSSDEIAQKIMDRIRIEDGRSGTEVYFRTKMDEMKGNWDSKKKGEYKEQSMQIDYAVYMPVSVPLDAQNQFGQMIVPDYRGPVELESKFGKLTAGKLDKVREINVEFGSAFIQSVSGGTISIKFSKAEINHVLGDIVLRAEFSDVVKLVTVNEVKNIDVSASYSHVYLDLPQNLSAQFSVRTSYGEFHNKTQFPIQETKQSAERYGPTFDKTFTGTSGSGTNRYKIKTEFGEVTIGHDLKVDMNEKKMSRGKGEVSL
jgi:hypothetical protein